MIAFRIFITKIIVKPHALTILASTTRKTKERKPLVEL